MGEAVHRAAKYWGSAMAIPHYTIKVPLETRLERLENNSTRVRGAALIGIGGLAFAAMLPSLIALLIWAADPSADLFRSEKTGNFVLSWNSDSASLELDPFFWLFNLIVS